MLEVIQYFASNTSEIILRVEEHLFMVLIATTFAVAIGIPLGVLFTRRKVIGEVFIYFSSIIFTIPSLALFGLLLPFLAIFGEGIGKVPAIIAVILYSLGPIIRNTYSGIINISPDIIEAANGVGMSTIEKLLWVELPMALPTIIAGIKISIVLGVATITVGTYIGSGGIGLFISRGISQTDFTQVIVGAFLVSSMALILDGLFSYLQWLSGYSINHSED